MLTHKLDTTRVLFDNFPRHVGKYRAKVYDWDSFQRYLGKASGREECYVSVYPLVPSGSDWTVPDGGLDKVTFDFDGNGAFEQSCKVYRTALKNGFDAIPAISGKKGFHTHILSQPMDIPQAKVKETLMDISCQILKEALGITDWADSGSVDWHVIGNSSALIRVPGTLRPPDNISYCSFLPPDYYTMDEAEVYRFTKSQQDFDYDLNSGKSLLDVLKNYDPIALPETLPASPSFDSYRGDYSYVTKLLMKRIADGRHRVSRFILCPYFANVVGLEDSVGVETISMWIDACSKLKETSAKKSLRFDYAYARAKGWMPWTLNYLRVRDSDLYSTISSVGIK